MTPQNPEKISRLSKEQVDYLNRQILSKGLLFDNSIMLGSHVWIPNADGGFTPIDPSLVTTTYGGKQVIDPRIFVNHTGGVEYPADYNLPTHTGGNQTVTNDKDSHILVGGESQVGDWRDGVVTRDNIDFTSKPKQKVNSTQPGDIVRTPDSHPDDFTKVRGAKRFKNKYTDEIWEVSDTRHSDKTGEWKVGLNGDLPNRNKKITIGRSDGKFIKIDNK